MDKARNYLLIGSLIGILMLISSKDFLLFHSLAELFSIVIAFGIFVIGWNSRKYYQNNYLLFIGIAYLFVAFFDTLHTLAYKGMTVFKGYDDNDLPPQLWLVARYMESTALLLAPLFFSRPVRHWRIVAVFSAISALAIHAIFFARIFPVCFVTGSGLTPFKVGSEYLIGAILIAALYLLHRNKEHFEPDVLKLLTLSITCTIVTELCFTVYVDLYGLANLVGHFFKIFAFGFMYKAIVETALARPYDLLFKNLQESKDLFKSLSEASFGGVIIHDKGLILECNKGLTDITGFSYEEHIGMNGLELIAPESLDTVLANIKSGYDQDYEVTGVRKDGSRYPLAIRGKNVIYKGHDARVIEFRDMTELKRAEIIRQKNEHLIRQLLESTDQGIYGIDQDGCCTFINRSALTMLGYDAADACSGRNMHDLIHHTHQDGRPYPVEDCPIYRAKLTGEGCRLDDEVLWRSDGTSFQAEYSSHPIIFDGTITGAVVTFLDITERKRTEHEREEALARVKKLEGIIPICMYCKKIRDDHNSWNQLEQYISNHSEAMFSHGICPQCYEEQKDLIKTKKTIP